ncbi:hypothetical protein BKA65DRAFT_538911 [Rhexocercosporidium sp. MPI-PUGE-AT-0058]|nr:hypothetical protein BKA65DRAFT_538911 [Rhexocercosporidium sp. MPI-PUGE-AT-0058]
MTMAAIIKSSTLPGPRYNARISFETLAPELTMLIMTQLPDLVCLDSLIRASPSALRLFNLHAVEITEAALDYGGMQYGQTMGHTRVMIRISALIRSSTLSIPNLEEFRQHVTLAIMRDRVRSQRADLAPKHFEPSTSPVVLRSILATNRRITFLAVKCLVHYLDRFMQLKPRHLVDRDFNFESCRKPGDLPFAETPKIWQPAMELIPPS